MRGWGLHLACLAVLAAQVGLWALGHRSDLELRAAAESDDLDERVEARFLLLERGGIATATAQLVLVPTLLDSDEPLEVDFAHTTAVCKLGGADLQYGRLKERMAEAAVDAAFWREFVLLRRKIGVIVGGSSGRLDRRELAWWFDALEGRDPPADEVLEQIRQNP